MNEQEWLTATDPERMLEAFWGETSDRKIRLFAVACCRRIWQLLSDERSRQAVEVAECYADSQVTEEELEKASDAACAVWDAEMERISPDGENSDEQDDRCLHTASLAAYNVAVPVGWWGAAPAFVAPHKIAREVTANGETERAAQCILLRDILGNPFRPVTLKPTWLAWKGGTVPKLAQTIYDERAFERLPSLADALEETACDDTEILAHCREPGSHFRGCWVVDLLLGKD